MKRVRNPTQVVNRLTEALTLVCVLLSEKSKTNIRHRLKTIRTVTKQNISVFLQVIVKSMFILIIKSKFVVNTKKEQI